DALSPVLMAEAEFRLLPNVTGELRDNTEVHLHIGTASVLAKLAFLETDRMTGGQSQMIQLRMSEPLGLLPGDRFVVRTSLPGSEQGRLTTIGGGRVLGTSNIKLRRRRPWTISNLRMRADAIDQPRHWIEQVLRESDRPLTFAEWAQRSFRSEEEMLPDLHPLIAAGRAVQSSNGQFVHIDTIEALADLVIPAVRALHTANPKRLGFHTREIAEALDAVIESPAAQGKQAQNRDDAAVPPGHSMFLAAKLAESKDVLSMAIEIATREGELERRGDLIAISGWRVSVSSQEELAVQRVESLLRDARFSPPHTSEIPKALGIPQNVVDSAIKLLIEQGKAVQVDDDLVFHSDAIAAAQAVVLELFSRAPSFTTMQFRDALGVSRKYAVPLLDYMDSQRFTVRTGNIRTPGVAARHRPG
ncbi:MAG: SelB C-terminal domain-containing protein, partial [Verrucomicrobiota bacterium]|nr:SelB C-terminal domain-containing protein [Verrucomicrobiota bacterium]